MQPYNFNDFKSGIPAIDSDGHHVIFCFYDKESGDMVGKVIDDEFPGLHTYVAETGTGYSSLKHMASDEALTEDPEDKDYWTKNGIEKPKQYVVCAACRIGTVILCGARHWDKVMRSQARFLGVIGGHEEQGFIDQFGDFLTRKEAMRIVIENGQKFDIERNRGDKSLSSEGLY